MSGYNGWNNYETWAAKLWLDNEAWSYTEVTERAKETYSDDIEEYEARYSFQSWLKNYVEEMMPELPASLASDLLSAALSEIDWYEIAQAYLADAKESLEPYTCGICSEVFPQGITGHTDDNPCIG